VWIKCIAVNRSEKEQKACNLRCATVSKQFSALKRQTNVLSGIRQLQSRKNVTTRAINQMAHFPRLHVGLFYSALTFWQELGKVNGSHQPQFSDNNAKCVLERTARVLVFCHHRGSHQPRFWRKPSGASTDPPSRCHNDYAVVQWKAEKRRVSTGLSDEGKDVAHDIPTTMACLGCLIDARKPHICPQKPPVSVFFFLVVVILCGPC
jgi:hypothetical protein